VFFLFWDIQTRKNQTIPPVNFNRKAEMNHQELNNEIHFGSDIQNIILFL